MAHILWTTLLSATLCFASPAAAQTSRVCNNSPLLCDRAYNNVTYLGAHDSMFVRNSSNGFSVAGDQFFTSPVQLDAGVRLLTGQVHMLTSPSGALEVHLCHTLCQLYDAGLLSGWLATIKSWLDDNPNDVITILLVNSDNLTADQLGPIFDEVDISQYAFAPNNSTHAPSTWPTLNEMIDLDKRLITFFEPLSSNVSTNASSYLLDEFTFVFENNYDVDYPFQFSCTANRPASLDGMTAAALASDRLPLMNHFLYDNSSGYEIPAVNNVTVTNAPSGGLGNLGDAATNCTGVYGKPPTYVLVDFFNVGPAIDTIDRLNDVQGNITGRRSLPAQIYTSGSGPTQTVPIIHPTESTTMAGSSQTPSTTGTSSDGSGMATSATTTATASQSTNAAPDLESFQSTVSLWTVTVLVALSGSAMLSIIL